MTLDRRTVLAAGLVGSALLPGCQTLAQPAVSRAADAIKLWPAGAPGGEGVNVTYNIKNEVERGKPVGRSIAGVTEPLLNLYRAGEASDTAILVIPGGGFTRVWLDKEGEDICRWLNTQGISAGSLLYRLPREGWAAKEDAPLQDAKRAARLLAQRTGAKRIGVMGFSAGGTIAAALATRWDEPLYEAIDDTDLSGVKPSFMALGYPYLNVPVPAGFTSMYRGMTAASPPAFFFLAADDQVVIPDNSLAAFKELNGFKTPSALHVFEEGGHGFALISPKGSTAAQWPDMFLKWARAGRHIPVA